MTAGRKPRPTALRIIEGNPAKRPLPKHEPKPDTIFMEAPPFLGRDAKKEWRRIIAELIPLGLFTALDYAALASYCAAFGEYAQANRDVKRWTAYQEGAQGQPQLSVYFRRMMQSGDLLIRALVEFGLSPASRTKVAALPPVEVADPWADLLP